MGKQGNPDVPIGYQFANRNKWCELTPVQRAAAAALLAEAKQLRPEGSTFWLDGSLWLWPRRLENHEVTLLHRYKEEKEELESNASKGRGVSPPQATSS
jgi:hypothetical protein